MFLFSVTLGLLRLVTNKLAPSHIAFHPLMHSADGLLFGLVTGYLVSGFLVCVLQTLPWHENFLFFDPTYKPDQGVRRVLPPDRVWLALMHRAGAYAFSHRADPDVLQPESFSSRHIRNHLTFDKYGTFEIRYARYRRYGDNRDPLPYRGEFNRQLHRGQDPG